MRISASLLIASSLVGCNGDDDSSGSIALEMNGTCAIMKDDGAACTDEDECAGGACNGMTTTTDGTCGPSLICNGQ